MQTSANGERALYTFLGHALVAPFMAGAFVLATLVAARPLKLEGLVPPGLPNPGEAAIATFLWAVIPSALAGLAIAAVVWRRGSYPWITAAAAGGIAFMLAAILMPIPVQIPLTPLTAIAAFIAIAVRQSLVHGGILDVV